MKQSTFVIANMDCPTEEALIRKRLGAVPGIKDLAFNLMERRLTVDHSLPDDGPILGALAYTGLGINPTETELACLLAHVREFTGRTKRTPERSDLISFWDTLQSRQAELQPALNLFLPSVFAGA